MAKGMLAYHEWKCYHGRWSVSSSTLLFCHLKSVSFYILNQLFNHGNKGWLQLKFIIIICLQLMVTHCCLRWKRRPLCHSHRSINLKWFSNKSLQRTLYHVISFVVVHIELAATKGLSIEREENRTVLVITRTRQQLCNIWYIVILFQIQIMSTRSKFLLIALCVVGCVYQVQTMENDGNYGWEITTTTCYRLPSLLMSISDSFYCNDWIYHSMTRDGKEKNFREFKIRKVPEPEMPLVFHFGVDPQNPGKGVPRYTMENTRTTKSS